MGLFNMAYMARHSLDPPCLMDLILSLVLSIQATLNVCHPSHHDPSLHRAFAPTLPFTLLISTHPSDLSFLRLSMTS